MLTISDELKGDMAKIDALIAEAEAMRERRKKSLADVEGHIDNLYVQRIRLEGQLARAEARLVRPTGKYVTLESNGVDWKV
jgi:hypothetical protein